MKLCFPPIPSKVFLPPFWTNTQQEGTRLPPHRFGAQRTWKISKTEYLPLWKLLLREETDHEQMKTQGPCRLWEMPWKNREQVQRTQTRPWVWPLWGLQKRVEEDSRSPGAEPGTDLCQGGGDHHRGMVVGVGNQLGREEERGKADYRTVSLSTDPTSWTPRSSWYQPQNGLP